MHLDLVRRLIPSLRDQKILVIGDLMLDEFIWGKVSRISPEAPVPIVEVSRESYYPGGAANVARNLREFTEHVSVMGLVGTSRQGEHLKTLLRQGGIGLNLLQEDARWQTIVKTRIIARQQHIVRFDRELRHVVVNAALERFSGQPAEHFLGKTLAETSTGAGFAAVLEANLRQVFVTGEPRSFEHADPGGARHYSIHLTPEFSPEGPGDRPPTWPRRPSGRARRATATSSTTPTTSSCAPRRMAACCSPTGPGAKP